MGRASSRFLAVCLVLAVGGATGCQSMASRTPAPTSPTQPTAPANVSIALGQSSASVAAGATLQFTATVTGTTNTAVTWSVDTVIGGNSTAGTITTSGLYTAPSQAGTHTVSATSVADTTKSASVTVTVTTGGSVSPTSSNVMEGATQQFSATFPGTANPTITWSVDNIAGGNSSVGTISAAGVYTAPSQVGSHNVTAAASNASASAQVTVFAMSVSPSSATIAPSSTQQFAATIQGLSNAAVTWSVDGVAGGNSNNGTITSTGLYSAPAAIGAHTVAATSVAVPTSSVQAALTVINISHAAVLTYHNDDARDGAYLEEVSLTPSNVNVAQFGKLASYPVDGQIYGQPLYLPHLSIAGGTHDGVYVATQNDSVYAFDADAKGTQKATFWRVTLGTPVPKYDYSGVSPVVGILSTPVIDATTNTIYVFVESSSGRLFSLHALDVATGKEKFGGPVEVTGTVSGQGLDSSGGKITLEPDCYQRMGLTLNPVTNAIYIAFGSCNHGWVLAYDKTTLKQIAVFNDTPDGAGGGLWASGGAPAIDDTTGDLYLMSGVDAGDQNYTPLLYNDSFLRLDPNNLSVLDFFAPNDNSSLAQHDSDLGSGANILMPDNGSSTPHEVIGGGKDGNIFVVNRDKMGGYSSSSNDVIQTVRSGDSDFDNIFSTPVYWNGFIYYHPDSDVLHAFAWSNGLLSDSPTSSSSVAFYQHGATASLSANGTVNGILWEVDDSNYNRTGTGSGPAVLHAYDATNVANELYNSSQAGSRDTAGAALKFTVPTIANGRVFVGTSNELDIFGLLPSGN
jgi:hypothetical protein